MIPIAGDVKTIVIETMKEENEKNQSSENGKDIEKQVKEYINIVKTEDREKEKRKIISFFIMFESQKVKCQQHVMIMMEINA